MENPIYTITAIWYEEGTDDEHRCFGFFYTLARAKIVVEENQCDMHECRYQYIVIEEIMPGIHSTAKALQWYKWEDNKWNKCESPDFSYITNWAGIG